MLELLSLAWTTRQLGLKQLNNIEHQLFLPPTKTHLANGPWNKSLHFIFPTEYMRRRQNIL